MSGGTSFGRWLQRRRKALSLTQADLAGCVGCATVTIHKIEIEERRPSTAIAERLAACLQIANAERQTFLRFARGEAALIGLAPLPPDIVAVPRQPCVRSVVPAPLTPLLGRARELTAVAHLVRCPEVRLITLTGAGGTGKTRLALQVAEELLAVFPDGVWFVDLAPIRDPDLVATAIARTLQVKEVGGEPITERLAVQLRDRQVLLVLDNFEQVVVAAPLVTGLLKAARGLKVLVTSRMPLRLTGEHELSVPPLALPDLARLPALDVLTQYPAVALFIQRVQQITPDFHVTDATGPVVAEICQRLDGLPLAIELAARRSKLFTPQALLARLRAQLSWLGGGARDLPARQQTLWATIAWSYQLLEPAEQTLFARLAVFVGGWTLEAAEAVCNANGDLPIEVVDGLQGLLDKSLLRQEPGADGEPRFLMLETIGEFAREQALHSGEFETLRRKHALYCLALAEAAEPKLHGAAQQAWLTRLESEHDNLRAALAWSHMETGAAETGLRLTVALIWFWILHGHVSEGRSWLEAGLAQVAQGEPQTPHTVLRARLLQGAGMLIQGQSDFAAARTLLEQSVVLWRMLGDKCNLGHALTWLGHVANIQGDPIRACSVLEEGIALLREAQDKFGLTRALKNLGDVIRDSNPARARTLFQESWMLARELGEQAGIAWSLCGLGWLAQAQGDYVEAVALLEETLMLFRNLGHKFGVVGSLLDLGWIVYMKGDHERADALLEEGLLLANELGIKNRIAFAFEVFGHLAIARAQVERAARLWGAADTLQGIAGAVESSADTAIHKQNGAPIRLQLSEASFAVAMADGRAMSLEQAIAYALEDRG